MQHILGSSHKNKRPSLHDYQDRLRMGLGCVVISNTLQLEIACGIMKGCVTMRGNATFKGLKEASSRAHPPTICTSFRSNPHLA